MSVTAADRAPAPAALRAPALTLVLALLLGTAANARAEDERSLAGMTLEQLGNIQVTSVLKRNERLADAPAAIYVITAEDIERSGATSLPEALRLAPNLEVARADAVQYAITARGNNSVLENKLLVMIDGRVVYSPLFSGVFWEAQDVALANVERIEVVSGPGGTLWGTNAVNGVINIILRSSAQTPGLLVQGGGGNDDRTGVVRYGMGMGEHGTIRATANVNQREATERADGTDDRDGATDQRGGFRADWANGPHALMLEVKGYRGDIDQGAGKRRITGAYAVGRWDRDTGNGASTRLQTYYDFTGRDQPGAIREVLNTFDVEFQQGLRPIERHDLLFGAGYRYEPDDVENVAPAALAFIPADRVLRYANAFLEDDITLARTLTLIGGIKAERNDYTGVEVLPTLRLAWKPTDGRMLWAAASRAVRAPARIDRELYLPGGAPHFVLDGGPNFDSEIANVYELGTRMQSGSRMSYSITLFHHRDAHLRSLEPGPDGPVFANGLEATNTGVEAWGLCRVTDHWRLSAGMVQQKQVRRRAPGSNDLGGTSSLGNDPTQWWTFRSAMDLGRPVQLDVMVREIGPLPSPHVPGYVAVDARIAWRVVSELTLAVSGRNLLDDTHPEWGMDPLRPVLDRAVFGSLTWRL